MNNNKSDYRKPVIPPRRVLLKCPVPKLKTKSSGQEMCRRFVEKLVEFVESLVKRYSEKPMMLRQSNVELLVQCRTICVNVIIYKLQQNKCAKPSAIEALHACVANNVLDKEYQPSIQSTRCDVSSSEPYGLSQTDVVTSLVIRIGRQLETMFPTVYRNISRKLNTTMKSEDVVSNVLTRIFENLFADHTTVTWAKIVSMFAVAGQIALECVQQGHSLYVLTVVEAVASFTAVRLVDWVHKQDGWISMIKAFAPKEDSHVSRYIIFVMTTITMLAAHLLSRPVSKEK